MIGICTVDNLRDVISKVKNKQITFLKIFKCEDKLGLEYIQLEDINPEERDEFRKSLDRSTGAVINLLTELEKLLVVLEHNKIPSMYILKFDCSINDGSPKITHSYSMPNIIKTVTEDKKPVVINWNEVFKDKLNEKVPGLFVKKSAKKYIQVSYAELAEILK